MFSGTERRQLFVANQQFTIVKVQRIEILSIQILNFPHHLSILREL
jgi:hypothetical protein